MNDLDRFMAKVGKSNDCWLWTGGRTKAGYGVFYVNRVPVYAHRFAYEHLVGPIGSDLHIDHVRARGCTNRHCVNPAHLEAVPQKENNARIYRMHCKHGHVRTDENTYVSPAGRRYCRTCRHLREALAAAS